MRLSQDLVQWIIETRVLTPHHVQSTTKDGICVLVPEAAKAAESGHLMFYLAYNIAHQCQINLGEPGQLRGSPGEPVPPADVKHNWALITSMLQSIGVPRAAELVGAIGTKGSVSRLLLAIRSRCDELLQASAPSPTMAGGADDSAADVDGHSPASQRRRRIEDDIRRAQEKHMQRIMAAEEAKRADERRRANARALSDFVAMSLDTERFRLDLASVGAAPLPAYTEFSNRAAVAMCHSIVDDIVADVSSGEASKRLDDQWYESQVARKHAKARREQGVRLVDQAAPVVVAARGTDRRVVLMCLDIVQDMVSLSVEPNMAEALATRERDRARAKALLREQDEKLRRQLPTSTGIPLRQRLEEAKQREQALEEQERRQREVRTEAARQANRAYAEEQVQRRARKEAAEWAAKEDEREKARQQAESLDAHRARAKMVTLHNKMRRLLFEMEQSERKELRDSEAALWQKLRGVATRERRLITEAAEADRQPTLALSSVSTGTGLAAAYVGDTYGGQYLTALESQMLDALSDVRGDPHAAASRMEQLKGRFVNQKLIFDTGSSKEPLMTVEGARGAVQASSALEKMRAARPNRPNASIGLTLAARQHACDLAYHGIANVSTHVGTDGSSVAQRVGKYGWGGGLAGANPSELVVGVVRHAQHQLSPQDLIDFWLLCDGDDTRAARKALFASGNNTHSAGIGHAIAHCEDRVVEVYCVVFAAEFVDKSVSQMSGAHIAAVSEVAAPFLQGERAVKHGLFLRDLFATTNLHIGRTAAEPDLRLLTQPLRSPRRRTIAGGLPARTTKPRAVRQLEESPPPKSRTPEPNAEFNVPPPAQNARRLSPIREKAKAPKPKQAEDEHDPVARAPAPPRERFVATPPLPPVTARVQVPPCAARAAYKWLRQLRWSQRIAKMNTDGAADQEREHAAVVIQRVVRGNAARQHGIGREIPQPAGTSELQEQEARSAAIVLQRIARGRLGRRAADQRRSDRRAEVAETAATEEERLKDERDAQQRVDKAEALSIARSVANLIFDAAMDTAVETGVHDECRERCVAYLKRANTDSVAIRLQLSKYEGRETLLLRTLVAKHGADASHLAAVAELHARLSIEAEAQANLEEHAGREADYIAGLERLLNVVQRCGRRWRTHAAGKNAARQAQLRKEETAAACLQRVSKAAFNRDRVNYVRTQQPRIRLKMRLERFYRKYNPEKVNDCGAFANKYLGAEDRLFSALVAKYGPEPPEHEAP